MAVNKRLLVLNTLFSYGRTLFGGCLTLFTTRWVINALGARDYGLYGLVGGMVALLGFVNISLAAGAQRFFSYAMDVGGDEVSKWFKTSVCIHLALSIVFMLLAAILYPIAFNGVFVIDEPRVLACKIVYWCAVASGFWGLLNVPFNAMFIAKQHIFELTILNMVVVILSFALAYLLLSVRGDRLVAYAVALAAINIGAFIVQMLRCCCAFKECRWKGLPLERSRVCQLLSFSGLTLMGTVSYLVRGQGLQIIFNRYGTTALNASYAVSNQVSGLTVTLAASLTNALSPGVISQYGAGDVKGACVWAIRSCKFSTVLSLIVFIPIFGELEYLLKLWLVNPPDGCIEFVRVMMVSAVLTQIVTGAPILVKASGKVVRFELLNTLSLLGSIILAWCCCRFFGFSARHAIVWIAISAGGCSLISLVEARRLSGFSLMDWLYQIGVKGGVVGIAGTVAALFVRSFFTASVVRVFLVSTASFIVVIAASWYFLLLRSERDWLLARLRRGRVVCR